MSPSRLEYDRTTSRYKEKEGIKVIIEHGGDFGGTKPAEQTMKGLIDYFVSFGYKRNKDFRAAPYDWRYAAGKKCINLRPGALPTITTLTKDFNRKIIG